MVTLLSQKLETLKIPSYQKNTSLPIVITGLDPPKVVQRPPGARQTLSTNRVSPLQTSIREAAHRGEDMQGFQMISVTQRRNAQRKLVGTHAPISFKLLKELKAVCEQYGSMAPFTQMFWENMSLGSSWPKLAWPGWDYLLWGTVLAEQCQITTERNRAQQVPIFYEMLLGEEPYTGTDQQLNFLYSSLCPN